MKGICRKIVSYLFYFIVGIYCTISSFCILHSADNYFSGENLKKQISKEIYELLIQLPVKMPL